MVSDKFVGGMSFYHSDGMVAAWKQAKRFAGRAGRIASLPDVIDARLSTKPGAAPWESYFTTTSAEYVGIGRNGKKTLIVAHGIGPMSTLDGIVAAYRYQFDDRERNIKGGRITEQVFRDLEDGKYGEVSVVDLESYCKRHKYPFIQILRASEAITDPVINARYGILAGQYVKAHAEYARQWHRERALTNPENRYGTPVDVFDSYLDRRRNQHLRDGSSGSDPFITSVGCSTAVYWSDEWKIDNGLAVANLLSVGGLRTTSFEGNEGLINEVGIHSWYDGTRLVATRTMDKLRKIHAGVDAHEILHKHWQDFFRPVAKPSEIDFVHLTKIGNKLFTLYPKVGDGMDSYDPEFLVTEAVPVRGPDSFTTTIGGYYGFFKYGEKEVKAIAPPHANAYLFTGEPTFLSEDHHIIPIKFYKVEVDISRRLIKASKIANDFDTLMKYVK
ncbi:MAG: hypothetical protein HY225_01790 [Candidatus Vogelbacteria bacterium]|nr:hypothetical protein [Candidatus Vogelbacteria bacterium]